MLFDDNLGFVGFNLMGNSNSDKRPRITTAENGFERGNMFDDLYDPYKNYTYYKIKPNNKREELLLEVMAYTYAVIDLGLYLDLHPNDEEVLKKFRLYAEKSCEKEMEFVKLYGPLELIDNDSNKEFTWIKNPWPWDQDGGAKYV